MNDGEIRLALFASGDIHTGGGGSTAEKITIDALEGVANFCVAVVVCNNPPSSVGVYDIFDRINRRYNLRGDRKIDVVQIGPDTHPGGPLLRGQSEEESAASLALMQEREVTGVATLGWLRIITGDFIDEYGWFPDYGIADPTHNGIFHPNARILNNHPGILPATADTHGIRTHEKAVKLYKEGKLKRTAMTIHMMGPGVDTGAVVFEEPVPLLPKEEASGLSKRVQIVEKRITAPTLEKHFKLRQEHVRGRR